MASTTNPTPDYGRRLMPTLIDERALSTPDAIYCYLSRSSKMEAGFRTITFQTLSNATNACCWWIESKVGKSDKFDTLAYLGPSDLRNIIIILAAIKTGHKVYNHVQGVDA